MKKINIFLITIFTIGCLCSCGGNDIRYDAIYDTKTKKYIEWGDTRETVTDALGNGIGQLSGENYETSNYHMDVDYYPYDNEELNAPIWRVDFKCYSNGRYKVLGISSEDELLKKFSNAKSWNDGTYNLHIAIDKSNGNYYLLENDKVNWPNNNCVPAYDIDIEFADDVIEYRLSNFMFPEEYKYYSSMDDHTIKNVKIVK